jgi:hypothetical protein
MVSDACVVEATHNSSVPYLPNRFAERTPLHGLATLCTALQAISAAKLCWSHGRALLPEVLQNLSAHSTAPVILNLFQDLCACYYALEYLIGTFFNSSTGNCGTFDRFAVL